MLRTGQEEFKLVRENKYDAILCDIKMAKWDGIEVLTQYIWNQRTHRSSWSRVMVPLILPWKPSRKGAYDYIPNPSTWTGCWLHWGALDRTRLDHETTFAKAQDRCKLWDDRIIGSHVADQEHDREVAPTEARAADNRRKWYRKKLVPGTFMPEQQEHRPFVEVNCAAIPAETDRK